MHISFKYILDSFKVYLRILKLDRDDIYMFIFALFIEFLLFLAFYYLFIIYRIVNFY